MSLLSQINELKDKRARLNTEARAAYDAAQKNGWPEAEAKAKWDKQVEDVIAMGAEIEKLEKLDAVERSLLANPANTKPIDEKPTSFNAAQAAERRAALWSKAFRHTALPKDYPALSPEEMAEARALQVDVDTSGGYTRPSEQFLAELLKNVDDISAVRGMARKFQVVNAESLGVPYLSARASNASWTTELQTGSADSQMAFGKRALTPNPLAKSIKVSEKLLRSSALPIENLVREEMAYVFGITEETAFCTGSGANQPLGLFTASASGINTDRDVSTGNSATSLTFDGLKEAKWTLKGQYHANAKWLFHRDALKQIDKLKDGDGQYIWQPSVVIGQPDRLLNAPVVMSDYVPNTFSASQYVGMFGDFSKYWIVDSLDFRLQRLNELYAETGQVGFIGRLECDGAPVLPEAFVRVKLSA